jgi:hypothetical protein
MFDSPMLHTMFDSPMLHKSIEGLVALLSQACRLYSTIATT